MTPHFTVCEFYSGIGGYHLALSSIPDLSFNVAAAFEISSNANMVYRHNFPGSSVLETNLCGLTPEKLDSIIQRGRMLPPNHDLWPSNKNESYNNQAMSPSNIVTSPSNTVTSPSNNVTSPSNTVTSPSNNVTSPSNNVTSPSNTVTSPSNNVTSRGTATVFVMSPPCQPFTRQGCKKDNADPRSESVLHLFDIFPKLKNTPDYFFIENVQGFETSVTRSIIIKFFETNGYYVTEFLLNSNSLGIPNSRLRYYLLARKQPFPDQLSNKEILTAIPDVSSELPTPPISIYLEDKPEEFDLPDKFLSKWGWVLDIVTPECRRSCCFTKGYSVKAEGSGSVIQQTPAQLTLSRTDSQQLSETQSVPESNELVTVQNPNNTRSMSNCRLEGQDFVKHMKSLNLRYFTPREIARIHGIPEWFEFPPSLSNKQLYKLLGNGLNVTVVRTLIENVLLT